MVLDSKSEDRLGKVLQELQGLIAAPAPPAPKYEKKCKSAPILHTVSFSEWMMEELRQLADLIEKYRVKIVDNEEYEHYYYVDYAHLNSDLDRVLDAIKEFIDTKFAAKFLHTYGSDEQMLQEIEEVLQEFAKECNKLKGIYKSLQDYELFDEVLGLYRKIIAKVLRQIDLFLTKLENLVLRGGEGSLVFELDVEDEVQAIRAKLQRSDKGSWLLSLLAGFGLGWLIFGGDGECEN